MTTKLNLREYKLHRISVKHFYIDISVYQQILFLRLAKIEV